MLLPQILAQLNLVDKQQCSSPTTFGGERYTSALDICKLPYSAITSSTRIVSITLHICYIELHPPKGGDRVADATPAAPA